MAREESANPFDNYMAANLDECISLLQRKGLPTVPEHKNGSLWCNATFDSFLCWPAIPANTSYSLPCPPLKGLLPEKHVLKTCHETGRWLGRAENDFSLPYGFTDYTPCMKFDLVAFARAERVAEGARKLEYVGIALSLISLLASIIIFSAFRRLRVFRNQMHQQLMISLLLNVAIRLILYVDQHILRGLSPSAHTGHTINSTNIVCEAFYLLLEYLKTVAFMFSFLEGFYLHRTVVIRVFQDSEPKLSRYLMLGWGLPALHVIIWILVVIILQEDHSLKRCLGEYYMTPEYFWSMDVVRLGELLVNLVFLLNIVYVLWLKVKQSQNPTEMKHIKKSVKAALMLIPLLGLPNILQTIPFVPSRSNFTFFAIYTYLASFFFMFQGLMVAVLYCFTNREVLNVIRLAWKQYRLSHQSVKRLRRVSGPALAAAGGGNNQAATASSSRTPSLAANAAAGGDAKRNHPETNDVHYSLLTNNAAPHFRRKQSSFSLKLAPPSYDDIMNDKRGGGVVSLRRGSSYDDDDVACTNDNDDVIICIEENNDVVRSDEDDEVYRVSENNDVIRIDGNDDITNRLKSKYGAIDVIADDSGHQFDVSDDVSFDSNRHRSEDVGGWSYNGLSNDNKLLSDVQRPNGTNQTNSLELSRRSVEKMKSSDKLVFDHAANPNRRLNRPMVNGVDSWHKENIIDC